MEKQTHSMERRETHHNRLANGAGRLQEMQFVKEDVSDVTKDGIIDERQSPRQRRQIPLVDAAATGAAAFQDGAHRRDGGRLARQSQSLHVVGGSKQREAILAHECDQAGNGIGEDGERLRLRLLILKPLRVESSPTLDLQLAVLVFGQLIILRRSMDLVFHGGDHVLAQRRGGRVGGGKRRFVRRRFAIDFDR